MSHMTAAKVSQIRPAVFNLEFRPFFLGAGVLSTVFMVIWMGVYVFG